MDADSQAVPLEERERRQDARDGPAGDGDQLVDRGPPEDQLAPDPAAPPGPSRRASAAASAGTPGSVELVGQSEIVDELRDPGHDPGTPRELAQEREATGRGGASTDPGTMKHSRPCSSAHEAVIRAPLRAGASTTTVASARPLITRFRRGKVPRVGRTSGASSETIAPPDATIAPARRSWTRGKSAA